ncbi:hypothetical protein DFH06DRAFT_1132162 [Mycena polygramma]|nr:hypothetical protein DFH06DRAFT_1143275 [Mycena polygramma]KAJ7656956.1 hypothetical protein DFH06DRAFT_1132162 [Mycena polygramma]
MVNERDCKDRATLVGRRNKNSQIGYMGFGTGPVPEQLIFPDIEAKAFSVGACEMILYDGPSKFNYHRKQLRIFSSSAVGQALLTFCVGCVHYLGCLGWLW